MQDLYIEFNVLQSFSKKEYPYDNTCIESLHASINRKSLFKILKKLK